ncbi:unnamed protein product [Polarella glacialis]|uniref:Uncharacterized protein n=1 Tax=Polarella glacialis TaxID=89957 RepID=A0A813JUI6_POLGL|nr:unnamed protein product [Polarella glacialis]
MYNSIVPTAVFSYVVLTLFRQPPSSIQHSAMAAKFVVGSNPFKAARSYTEVAKASGAPWAPPAKGRGKGEREPHAVEPAKGCSKGMGDNSPNDAQKKLLISVQ